MISANGKFVWQRKNESLNIKNSDYSDSSAYKQEALFAFSFFKIREQEALFASGFFKIREQEALFAFSFFKIREQKALFAFSFSTLKIGKTRRIVCFQIFYH